MTGRRSSSFYIGQGSRRVVAYVLLSWLVQLQRSDMVALCAGIPNKVITCDAGTVHVGHNATVTCNFPMDVGAIRGEVTVERLPKNADIRKDTLGCGWKEKEKTHACHVAAGFVFDGVITRNLTIVIPDVSEEYAGTYTCFLVSDEETPSKTCELIVKERYTSTPATTSTHSTIDQTHRTEESSNVWVIPVLIAISVTSLVVVAVVLCKRRIKRKLSIRRRQRSDFIMDPVHSKPLIRTQPRSKIDETLLKCFELSAENCQQVMDCIAEEMNKCPTDNNDTDIMQPPMSTHDLPKGKEHGAYVVVDLSGIVLKIHHVKLQAPQPETLFKSYSIPVAVRLGTGIQLFDFIADSVRTFLREQQISRKRRRVAFVVSFPCKYEPNLTGARLIKCTGGFQCEGLVGKNVMEMLQQAFDRKIPKCRLDVTVGIDDTAATLMSVLDKNQSCRIAVTLDNGFHACYLEEQDVGSSHRDVESKVLVIADLGALGENGCLDMLKTDYDKILDEYSIHPKKQILGKMVSIAHTGEQVRLVLAALAKKGLLFKSVPNKSVLNQKDCFTADYVSLIESDNCNHFVNTDYVLRQLPLENCSAEDCEKVYEICNTILKRAAHLAAAGLAAFIKGLDAADDVTIAVDGAMNRYYPHFHQLLCDETQHLVQPKKVKLLPSYYGSVMGAALTTAVLRPYRKVPSELEKVAKCVNKATA